MSQNRISDHKRHSGLSGLAAKLGHGYPPPKPKRVLQHEVPRPEDQPWGDDR